MRTKRRIALVGALVLLLVLGCLLYFVPWSTPIDLSLNATKISPDGNELGTTQITIHGNRLDYLFQDTLLDIEIDPFDDFGLFETHENSITGKKGEFNNYNDKFNYISVTALSPEWVNCTLYFTDGFEHIVFMISAAEGDFLYVASAGNDHTAEEVIKHFKNLGFNLVEKPTQTTELSLYATKFDSNGNKLGTAEIPIVLYETGDYFQDRILDIAIQDFDGWSGFFLSEDASTGKGGIIKSPLGGIYTVSLACFSGNDLIFCKLYFTESFDHFVLYIDTDNGRYTYLATLGGDHSADKVLEHFRNFNFNPVSNHKYSTELSLYATKFDSNGNELGTTKIPIILNETADYFQDGILDIAIQDFDGWSNFTLFTDFPSGKVGVIRNSTDGTYTVHLTCWKGNNFEFCTLRFTDSFDHFVVCIDTDNGRYTYLASIGNDHSADKVLNHFRSLRFDPLPSK